MKREWLIQFRVTKKLTQAQVANFAFIDRGYYSQIETGKRNPSHTVATNIAKVLDFDPILFFQNDTNESSFQSNLSNGEIPEFFRNNEFSEVLYLYNNFKLYYQHVISFILTGVQKSSFCIVIDYFMNLNHIRQSLQPILKDKELENFICFIDMEELMNDEPEHLAKYFHELLWKMKPERSIRIWLNEKQYCDNDWLCNIQKHMKDSKNLLEMKKILFVRSYNASLVSAVSHIKMMRKYPYLMTDFEIADSPFYQFSNSSNILPSFDLQEEV
ncbi:helix-turn-helix domain-containing protein [Ornithinibacillus sp. L9]|uniref:Helix-turn-helix domain-containing protein n=1 Tax=Ornithinibacillus caprae TaxID=2678566 RepID=A0A6N8FFE7_9BACI|nr:helix-turn-helix transcriptional regulator [Ornithinibacillus caprae]MUK87921.1 helix-turn-helix domain-containing protein [Ornithinibacillus caprae]